MKRVDHWISAVCLVGALFFTTSCDRKDDTSRGQHERVTIATERPPASVDPLKVMDVHSHAVAAALHAPLALVNNAGELEFVLAQTIEMAPDGMSCKMKLRNAEFWDGSQVTADDVIFSFERLRKSAHPHRWILDRLRGVEEFDSGSADSIAGLSARDSSTVRAVFSVPDPGFPYFIACEVASIVKRDSLKTETPRPYDMHVVGCGPFKPDTVQAGTLFEFERNSGYPIASRIKKLRFVQIDNPQNQLLELSRGSVDVVRLRGPMLNEGCERSSDGRIVPRERLARNTKVVSTPANELSFLILNWQRGPLADVLPADRPRWLATLSKGLDRAQMCENLYQGQATPAWGVVPPRALPVPGEARDHSLPRASVSGITLKLLCSNDPDNRTLATFIQSEAQRLGLNLELAFIDLPQLVQRLLAGDYEIASFWIEQAVPSEPGGGPIPWCQFWREDSPFKAVGQAIDGVGTAQSAARGVLAQGQRLQAYAQLVRSIDQQQHAWLPLLSRDAVYMVNSDLVGVFLDINGIMYYAFLDVPPE